MEHWKAVALLAGRQHGVVTRRQCLDLGVPGKTLTRNVARFNWRTLYPGVFALPGTAPTFAQQTIAALFAVGSPALVTGAAALHLSNALPRPRRVALLVPAHRAVAPRDGVEVVRTEPYADVPITRQGPLPLARSPRAVADHARHLGPVPLGRLMAKVCALRHASLSAFDTELEARKRFPGRASFREALGMLRGELTHSGAERAARRHARNAGIKLWPRPYPVEHRGRVIAEIDLAAPWMLYGIEIDGPHHDLPEQAAADKQRDRELRRLGWRIDRFPVELVERHPEQFVREVRAAISLLDPGRR